MWDLIRNLNGTAILEQITAENAMSLFGTCWNAIGENPVKTSLTVGAGAVAGLYFARNTAPVKRLRDALPSVPAMPSWRRNAAPAKSGETTGSDASASNDSTSGRSSPRPGGKTGTDE
jgi:hypothetical protein